MPRMMTQSCRQLGGRDLTPLGARSGTRTVSCECPPRSRAAVGNVRDVASTSRSGPPCPRENVRAPFRKARAPTCLIQFAHTDPNAFADFYDAYGERVMSYLLRRAFDAEIAYDMHAETFAIAFERRRQFRGATPEEEQAWLFAIARSQLTQYWRRGTVERGGLTRLKLDRPALDDDAVDRLERIAELDDLRPRLAAAMSEIPEEQAEAVSLRIIHETSYAEIARIQGVAETLVRARVSRGLRTLEKLIGLDDNPADAS